MRCLQVSARLILALWLALAPVKAWAGNQTLLGAGGPSAAVGYQGPGDVVSGASVFGSCARSYNAAYANGTNPLCDLVAITGGATVCTLRVKTNGFVDLTGNYCAGTTPSAACAAASGAKCLITKIYDQTGNSNHFTQATLANMALLVFNVLGGLPSMENLATTTILTSPSMTVAVPLTMLSVAQRTGNLTTGQRMIVPTTLAASRFSYASAANTIVFNGGVNGNATASDSVFHAMQAVEPAAGNSTIVVDAATTSVAAGNTGISAQTMSIMNDNSFASTFIGDMMEFGIWPSGFNATQYGNMNTNIHSSTNGYNF